LRESGLEGGEMDKNRVLTFWAGFRGEERRQRKNFKRGEEAVGGLWCRIGCFADYCCI
jgi:hypothetical protein